MKTRILFLVLSCFILASGANAKVKLPSILGDHMVLQQKMPLKIWGWDDPGQKVTVALAGKKGTATADADGKWKVSLPALLAGGPYNLVISGSDNLTVQDVLVGEVWLGSGQSNMELAMRVTHDAEKEIPAAQYPKIRLFSIERTASLKPNEDMPGSWKVCTPDTVKDFSAVAYHFGKGIHQSLKIPVGMIVASWGGAPGEDFIPREALDKNPAFASLLDRMDHDEAQVKTWTKGYDYALSISDIRLIPKNGGKAVPIYLEKGQKGLGGNWNASVKPGSTAVFKVEGKGFSGNSPAGSLSGVMEGGSWGGLTTPLDPNSPTLDLTPYESIEFYVKGHGKFLMTVGQASITDYDFYNTGSFDLTPEWKRMSYSISSLKQGGWGAHKDFTPDQIQTLSFNMQPPYWPEIPALIFNGMIAPLTPYKIRGVVWYQGESNAGRASQYHELLSTLIKSWREAWEEKFSFLIIQLPNYMQVREEPSDSDWAKLRESQLQTLDVPNTGLVTTIDIGEAGDIHPKNKTEVGRRAALAGLKTAYLKKIVGSGPLFVSAAAAKGKMSITFKEVGKGLAAKGGYPLKGFALAGPDGQFYWADAKIITARTVIVSSTKVAKPAQVRYAWADNPVCNLVNSAGLPASPFRFGEPPAAKATAPAAPAVMGKALPSANGKLLIDDFESGKPQNLVGGPWQVQFDNGGLGTTMKNQTNFLVKDGANGSKGAARIFGHFGKMMAPWPYSSIFTSLLNEDLWDISEFKAIEFMAKGDGQLYDVLIFPSQITDYAHFRHSFTAPKTWTKIHLDLSTFNQPDWGAKVAQDFHSVKEILFAPSGMNDVDYDLSIDDVTLVK